MLRQHEVRLAHRSMTSTKFVDTASGMRQRTMEPALPLQSSA
jgi:hypothetical protein